MVLLFLAAAFAADPSWSGADLVINAKAASGARDRTDVTEPLVAARSAMRACFAHPDHPVSTGVTHVQLDFTVDTKGRAGGVKSASGPTADPWLDTCLAGVVRGIEFAPSDARAQVTAELVPFEVDTAIRQNAGVLGALRDGEDLERLLRGTAPDGGSGVTGGVVGGVVGGGVRAPVVGGGGVSEGLGGMRPPAPSDGPTVGGDPIILGSLDKSLIDAVIKQNMRNIRTCYEAGLTRRPELAGKVTIKFVIAADGTVSSATVKSTTLGDPPTEECLTNTFLSFQFPQPKGGGIVIVSYPFVFSAN